MKYKGMTINEALCESGLIKEFDKAVSERDVEKVRSILKQLELDEPSILPILEHYGLKSKNKKEEE
jgi:hypothetical protein